MIGTCLKLLALAVLVIGVPAEAQPGDRLIGIWGTTIDYGPKLHGRLIVRKLPRGYTATIDAERATASVRGDRLRFRFGGDGSFRGRIEGRSIDGFWIQPGSDAQNGGDPGGSGQSFATPMLLRPLSAGMWSGKVAPLKGRFTLWLSIFRDSDGTLTAAFRNPEINSTGGASRFQVFDGGTSIRFSTKAGDRLITHSATYSSKPDQIRLQWPDAGRTLELARRTGAEAAAFYPRPPRTAAYIYRRPAQLSDGWRTARASATGLDEQELEGIVRDLAVSDPTARPPQLISSILVAHRGRLILEEYFYGFDRSTVHDLRSAGKTFGSVLLGTAPARSRLAAASKIYDVMRPMGPFANPDPRKQDITLAHLMTHTSGLACDDNDNDLPGNEGTMQMQTAEPNWWRYTLNLPLAHDPGTRYAYCSANSNLVGGALTEATGTWLPELFCRTVADPLQFGEWHWNLMANGEGYLGGGAFLLPRISSRLAKPFSMAGSGMVVASYPKLGCANRPSPMSR